MDKIAILITYYIENKRKQRQWCSKSESCSCFVGFEWVHFGSWQPKPAGSRKRPHFSLKCGQNLPGWKSLDQDTGEDQSVEEEKNSKGSMSTHATQGNTAKSEAWAM
ncbi:MAG: hypothetical protein GXP63_05175 [DPANN group archaeon]|nr:hypothetical protein [DPANN group archaeon]